MSQRPDVALRVTARVPGLTTAAACGDVTPAAVPELRDGLVKLLVEGVPVLLDVGGLRLGWVPAPELFVTAVTAAGGWPLARLVLYGADAQAAERLRACRVPDSVPLAATRDDAAALVATRPARLSYGVDLPAAHRPVGRARAELREVLDRWGLDERADVIAVGTELVSNAIANGESQLRLRLVLDRSGIRVSVRDRRPASRTSTTDLDAFGDRGLPAVARLSMRWGVVPYGDGKTVWAQLPPVPVTTAPEATRLIVGERNAEDATAQSPPTAVGTARRRRFTTADPEHAHAFLHTVYGAHTLRLSDGEGRPGFHLDYDGFITDRFAVEHLTHGATIEGVFATAGALVVVQPIEGSLRIVSGDRELVATAEDLVLCGSDPEVQVASTEVSATVVRLSTAAVAAIAADLTGFVAPCVPFPLSRAVSPARAALWRAVVEHLRRDVLGDEEVMASSLSRSTILRDLVAALVETFPNPARDALAATASRGSVGAGTWQRAVAYIEEHARDEIGLTEIAAAAGIGARALQLAFRRNADTTPLGYLRRVRLERAHRDLLAADPTQVTVGTVANRWGFPHHANFSTLYLRAYGRSPSVTLRAWGASP
jgi:AraC-like DNA-binding protein